MADIIFSKNVQSMLSRIFIYDSMCKNFKSTKKKFNIEIQFIIKCNKL